MQLLASTELPLGENKLTNIEHREMTKEGRLKFYNEFGITNPEPKEIAIIPRGLVYRVGAVEGPCRGFTCEAYGQEFESPPQGPIGTNGMANSHAITRISCPN